MLLVSATEDKATNDTYSNRKISFFVDIQVFTEEGLVLLRIFLLNFPACKMGQNCNHYWQQRCKFFNYNILHHFSV